MSHQAPSSGGPARQPLQTYLQTPVRPAAPAAAPVAQPLYAQPATQTHTQPQTQTQAPAQLFSSQQQQPQQQLQSQAPSGGLFAAPPLFSATTGAAAPGSDHLSSLLHTSPSSTPRPSVSVFGENAGSVSQAGATAPVPSSTSSSPNSPQTAPVVRLEQTMDHPLLGASPGLSAAQTPSPPPGAQGLLGSTVLSGPLGPGVGVGGGARSQPGLPARRAGTLPAPLTHAVHQDQSAGMVRASPQPSHPSHLGIVPDAQQQQAQAQVHVQAPLLSPQSPDEKLSTLMANLFGGPPPPAKLASFDVSSVSKDESGLVLLAEKGCWREVLKLAETLLDIPHSTASAAATATAAAVSPPLANTTIQPHVTYRYLHYYIAALVKLKKYDAAQQACQQRVGSLFSADKLYASHPAHYPAGPNANPAHVGNMVPFELHMLATELAHYNSGSGGSGSGSSSTSSGGQSRTRYALDQAMKLMQLLRAQIARKRAEESGTAGTPAAASPSPPPADGGSKRGSVSDPASTSLLGTGATGTATLTSNPFSLTSPHTLSPLSLRQLQSNLSAARLHVVNLCLNFCSSLEVDFEQALAWLAELREDAPEDPTILHAMARVHLQIGDLATAAALVAQARAAYEALGQAHHVQIGLHQTLLHLARNDYGGAHALMSSLYATHPHDIDVVNNYAVSCLYVPDGIQAGIRALESLVRHDPVRNLRESVLSNLRALYDLSSTREPRKQRDRCRIRRGKRLERLQPGESFLSDSRSTSIQSWNSSINPNSTRGRY